MFFYFAFKMKMNLSSAMARPLGIYAGLLLFLLVFSGKAYAQKPKKEEWKPVVAYHSNGRLMLTGNELNGQKEGRWEYFTDKGLLEKREKWKKGKMKWAVFYNEKRKKTRSIDSKGREKKYSSCGC
jgi:hypothetical protein